ncbi:MAG: hypothetical protein HUK09_07030 [Bacteroidaceae bacterium]|nr:hypothetical protein [Bacteroidaceae bacterium]
MNNKRHYTQPTMRVLTLMAEQPMMQLSAKGNTTYTKGDDDTFTLTSGTNQKQLGESSLW